MQSNHGLTWTIKWNNLMWDFLSGTKGDEIHIFNLFAIVGDDAVSSATAEIRIQQSVRDLIFLRVWGETNYTYFLRDEKKQQIIRCGVSLFILISCSNKKKKSVSPLCQRHGFSPRSPKPFGGRSFHQPGLCLADPVTSK